MGDGGVACVPSQHIMEQFPISDTFCGGNNGKFNSKSLKQKVKMKVKREEFSKKTESGTAELGCEKANCSAEVENGESCVDKVPKEEIEEGELGSLKWPTGELENGEFIPGKPQKFEVKSEIEKAECPIEKWRKGELEKGEFLSAKWRKEHSDKGEFSSGRSRTDEIVEKCRKGEPEKTELGSWRGSKAEIEKGEFIPVRRHKSEVVKEKMRRDDSSRNKGLKSEREWTPPSGKYATDKEIKGSGSQHLKRSSRWETGQERNPRLGSKIVVEDGSIKFENSNGKNHGKEHLSGNRLKRHGNDSDSGDRKHYGEYGDYVSSKSRRLSDDGSRSTYSEHYRTAERSYRNSSASRNIASDRYSSRHYESSLSSRVAYDRHGCSPRHSERSPRDRQRCTDHRDRTPVRRERSPHDRTPIRRERSPHDRGRYYDHRNRSPSYSDRSPQDRGRHFDRRDWTPSFLERSSVERNRHNNYKETNRKNGGSEKRASHHGSKEEKLDQKDSCGRDTHILSKESQDRSDLDNGGELLEKNADLQSHVEEVSQNQGMQCKQSPQANGIHEELPSMEEDMDICDTPPHVPAAVDSTSGKWFYLDHFGVERGPSKLCNLKALVEEGFLVSDHLIKHLDSDRWVTVENAVSPLVTLNLLSIVSDSVTQLVSPPEAPGNLLVDSGDAGQSANQLGQGTSSTLLEPTYCPGESLVASEPAEDLHIDVRVGALLEGYSVIPGQELETVGEALQMSFERGEWKKYGDPEGFTWHGFHFGEQQDEDAGNTISRYPDHAAKEASERSIAVSDRDTMFAYGDSTDWFSGRWPCKGGDWKRHDEAAQDRSWRKKFVLNDGYPLCQMPKSGLEDPRWHWKDDLYRPSHSRRLDLPPWAFSLPDESNDCSAVSRLNQSKPVPVRGTKGNMLPVVRINTCVVKDHGSFVSEPRAKVRGKDRYSSRSSRAHSGNRDVKRSSEEHSSQSKSICEQESRGFCRSTTSINIPKDRLCTGHDLQLHLGDWYYLDGAGHEHGPSSFSEMQVLVDQGVIRKDISVFRKVDRVWVPLTSAAEASEPSVKIQHDINKKSSDASGLTGATLSGNTTVSSSFHRLHPQFIGFTRGKLHELVMKSYKSREFAAAINEVLDPWISAKQPKKEIEKYMQNQFLYSKFQNSGKRARLMVDECEEDYEIEEELVAGKEEWTFDHLCSDAIFHKEDNVDSEIQTGCWGLLDGHALARIFHFLGNDVKSLVFAALTCKHWRAVVNFYKDISREVDLSSLGPSCTDSIIWKIMNGYKKEKITSLVLLGCTNVSLGMLEKIIRLFPSLSCMDIRGCSQLIHLVDKFPNINWIKSRGHSKLRSLKHINERTSTVFKSQNGLESNMDDSSGLRDYFESLNRRDSANQSFRKSLYKRSKLYDARKSSSILSRDAHLRHWAVRKSESSYKRMEEFLVSGLKDIMKENTFDFFVPKVAEIENRMKSGYYAGRGLSSVKEDISRMCRDAIKAKNRGDAGDMNRIVTLFIRLATRLEGGSKLSHERDEMMKNWKDDLSAGLDLATSKYKKKLNKVTEKKMIRSYGTSINGGSDYGEYASDREIRRRLSRLNKKSMDSGSETSDELNGSSEETKTDSESSDSDTESGSDFQSESRVVDSRGDGYFPADDGFDSLTDEREWGARMTKASLVPPVTRKYEIIDRYVIVADEELVKRKMQVSLPDDYAEKLSAQRNGTEESDMEIPEVKDYKPRKQLGVEVIEQEVYGIDPYTHNLLLDSMPEGSDWSLQDKHVFIEDVLLRMLNKQVRHFTGTGNTPMMYPLQPVVEDILKTAKEEHDTRIVKFCECILKAIDSRPGDNYVAYRKGLGVVCNKEGGFGEEDFVVEFLGEVYPAWKWFEKQDGIRSLQKNSEDPAPEFYNINLERPKGDADGYDLVVVDAMHKANYASRICHSCRPNCEAKVTAVDGQYQIGIYAVRPIEYGEEITFDYNSVTESKEEYEASVCLCGSQVCRGSYLNLTGEGAFQKVLKEWHGILDRHHLLLEACELNYVSEEDYIDLGRAGLGSCLLGGLPDWLIAYSARLVRFINFERTKLPDEILRHNVEEKRKYFADISIDVEKSDAEVQAEGVFNQRLQNLALTLDKVRYVMRCVFGDPKNAPPPVERLSPEEAVSFLWKGEGSLVDELTQCIAPHMDASMLKDLKSKIHAHDPSGSNDIQKELRKSLIWLRDEVRNLSCTYKCRHDAAADLIHIYAHTKFFFRVREYKAVTSPPVYISPLDLGPKYSDKLGSGFQEYSKTYGENYCLGQLIYWYNQTNAEPDCNLARGGRGCLSLPDIGSFYAKVQKPSRHRVYGPRTVKFMLARMEKQPQRPWPKDRIWSFKNSIKIFGSPMLDAVMHNCPLDRELVHWLKNRPAIFQAMWDR
ncbi:histone-lysine N-methyltransferase ATXR3 isoform X2 [Diospyros lotus]|uniref:histone-lysine N-methyltransferase ATXR3 isoform X2 n=1 Tax=Diospyros lotus TaxID=55363 RepID=UPI00225A15E7|nr:histone-lysine N-methyltransferase ATXR3 isoform X2 [Diospyros lotus]